MDGFQFDPRKKGRAYSKGNRQKVALIAAFAVPADLYILDEPTSGLDPLMEVVFRDEIARGCAPPARRCCCRATSSPRSSCCAIGCRSSARAASSSPARCRSCGTSPAPRCRSRHGIRALDGSRLPTTCTPSRGRACELARSTATPSIRAPRARRARAQGLRDRAAVARGAVPPPLRRRPRAALESCGLEAHRPPRSGDASSAAAAAAAAPRLAAAAAVDRRHRAARLRRATPGSASRTRPSPTGRSILAAVIANPVILMFRGLPVRHIRPGAFLAFEILPWLALLAALMSTFLAVRHTRGDEEAGRAELVAATPAGRRLRPSRRSCTASLANVALAALTALALIATGVGTGGSLVPRRGSRRHRRRLPRHRPASPLSSCAHRAERTRSTIWVLVATFLIRGIGNVAGTPSDDLTRIDERVAGVALAVRLGRAGASARHRQLLGRRARRSRFGLAPRRGSRPRCSRRATSVRASSPNAAAAPRPRPALRSPHALVWRLTSGSIIGWAIGGALTGILATTLSGARRIRSPGENPAVAQILEKIGGATGSLDEAVITVFFTLLGILAACAPCRPSFAPGRRRRTGTAEPVLAAPSAACAGSPTTSIVATVAVAHRRRRGDGSRADLGIAANGGARALPRRSTVTGLGQLVAASVFTVLTALVFVVLPRATSARLGARAASPAHARACSARCSGCPSGRRTSHRSR